MAPRELGDHRGSAPGIHRKLTLERFRGDWVKEPTEAVMGLPRKCVLLVCGGVVDQNVHGAELSLCNIEQALRCLRIGEVGLYCRSLSSFRTDCANNVSGVCSPY